MTTGVNALEAVILAAGAGTRFGGAKLTAPWQDGVLLDGALAAAFAAPVRSVMVVWGADPGVPDAARRLATRLGQSHRLKLVHAPEHAEGLAASLRKAIAQLPGDAEGALVFLGDMPDVPHSIAAALIAAVDDSSLAAAPVRQGRRGHPVLLTAALFPAVRALTGDQGAGRLLAGLGDRLALVDADDPGVLFDVDVRPQV